MPNSRRRPQPHFVPHLHAVLSLYEMSDSQLLARRSALLGELLRSLTPEERAWMLDIINVVYLAGYRDGAKAHPKNGRATSNVELSFTAPRADEPQH